LQICHGSLPIVTSAVSAYEVDADDARLPRSLHSPLGKRPLTA
jgi:hypothetical protein